MSDGLLPSAVLLVGSLLMLGIALTTERVMLPGVNREKFQSPGLFWFGVAAWAWMALVAIYLIFTKA